MTPAGKAPGFVYLITDGTFSKVGFTKNLEQRLETLQNATPHDLRLVDAVPTDDMRGLEAFLHGLLAAKHHRNEWFTLIGHDEWRIALARAQSLLAESYQEQLPLRIAR